MKSAIALTMFLVAGLTNVAHSPQPSGKYQTHTSLYYSYDKSKPLFKRLISFGSTWPVYCERCAKPVPIGTIVLGIAISDASLKAADKSAVVQQLQHKDWSIIDRSTRPNNWVREPNLRIELGRCNGCAGPFSAFGQLRGSTSDDPNTILMGSVFLGELQVAQAVALFEKASQRNLFGNEEYEAKAIAICRTNGRKTRL